ncbi:helix-turn-helix domain-containing protein [Aureibaculum luteum]|uniref:helix-turn-helix domain-containing protein n=1 Tax=Aureibaculum luteum TaxID=1548456 RepID=UPI000E51DED7|nr:helix-turn-helix transcriptional regulator [Aureibaculum luteum]
MASKAYLKMLEEIPKEIQNDVFGSIDIANEIYTVLKQEGMTPADLARLMDKSESEISKWLTGLHNFTFKTVRKIGATLGTDLIVSKSSKIKFYEELLHEKEELISRLKGQLLKLNEIKVKINYTYTKSKYRNIKIGACESNPSDCWSFKIYDEESKLERDNIKIEPVMSSKLHTKRLEFIEL